MTYSYRWCRVEGPNCVTVDTGHDSYTAGAADIGKRLEFVVTATNLSGPSAPASSDPTAPVASDPPDNHAIPEFSGPAQEGSTLTRTSFGTWSDPKPTGYASQWLRCDSAGASCEPIAGATAGTYVLGHDDVGHRIVLRVTARHPYGSRSADSEVSPLVLALPSPAPLKKRKPQRLRPFPKIIVLGNLSSRGALFREVVVRGPRNVTVQVRCRGRGCPYRRKTYRMRHRRLRIRSLERNFGSGTVIELRVVKRGRVGKYTRIRIRRGRIPSRMDRCLNPGSTRPRRCS
ncbi:MAG: hypothetical protein ACJ766_05525 [Thermoleophilaceae bacterium]